MDIVNEKPSNLNKDQKGKTKGGVVRGGIWSEIRCCLVFNGVKLQMLKPLNTGSQTLYLGDRSPTTCRLLALLKTKLTWIPFLSFHLMRFVVRLFVGHPYFCLRSLVSLAVSLTIGIAISIAGEIVVSLSR